MPGESLFYFIIAGFTLGFLIFIHELGHYFVAKWTGMQVESFGIGLGKPIISWTKNGTHWNIGWIPFGGYVKIAGTESEGDIEPHKVPGGFFSKPPLARIAVAAAGPLANFIFAIGVFALLYSFGGREKPLAEFSSKIGWIDSNSELYQAGVRSGDEITSYDGHPFSGGKDHLYAAMLSDESVTVEGYRVNYLNGKKTPFKETIHPYSHPKSVSPDILTTGILAPANMIFYDYLPNDEENPLPINTSINRSGLQYGDRISWADGEMIFSLQQLNHILNDQRALLTVKRNDATILMRIPRVQVRELRLTPEIKAELEDWKFEGNLRREVSLTQLYYIPYNLNAYAIVEGRALLIEQEEEDKLFPKKLLSQNKSTLQPGDKVIAVDGMPIQRAHQLFTALQKRQLHIIVERTSGESSKTKISSTQVDHYFNDRIDGPSIQKLALSVGSTQPLKQVGNFVLLNPVTPIQRKSFPWPEEKKAWVANEMREHQQEIEAIQDPNQRKQALKAFEEVQNQFLLGIPAIQDLKVQYNIDPLTQMTDLFKETWRTLSALVMGYLNPKWVSGPIGIFHVIHNRWMAGLPEALFWLGVISLNLGFLNLLPIPVLDGGHIFFSLFEMITGRRIKLKTIERMVIPFMLFFVCFFVYITYHDIARIFFRWF